jgi:hypothetical protein
MHPAVVQVIVCLAVFAVTGVSLILLFILIRMVRKRQIREASALGLKNASFDKEIMPQPVGDFVWALGTFACLAMLAVGLATGHMDSKNLILTCMLGSFSYRLYKRKTHVRVEKRNFHHNLVNRVALASSLIRS